MLDRNGLRPSRYVVTDDGRVIMASEVGALEIAPEEIVTKGRLEPGKMFLVDLEAGPDRRRRGAEARDRLGQALRQVAPASTWSRWPSCPRPPRSPAPTTTRCCTARWRSATRSKTSSTSSARWATDGEEAIGSMGTDTPLAVLSDRAQPLFNYFKQLFAQVTNPPLDAIREELVTSVFTGAGGEGNLLEPDARVAAARSRSTCPILDNDELARLKQLDGWRGFKSAIAADALRGRRGGRGAGAGPRRSLFDQACRGDRGRGQPDHPLRPRRRAPRWRRSRRSWPARACITTWSAGACGPAPGWSSSAATPARSTTSPCCWATAPARSTPTWPSRRSTT